MGAAAVQTAAGVQGPLPALRAVQGRTKARAGGQVHSRHHQVADSRCFIAVVASELCCYNIMVYGTYPIR